MLEGKLDKVVKAINENEPKEKVKELYDDYVETYRAIKVPKAFAMIEFRDLFFIYNNYMKEKK